MTTEIPVLTRIAEAEPGDATLATIRRRGGRRTETVHIAMVDHHYGESSLWVSARCGISGSGDAPYAPVQADDLCGSCVRSVAYQRDMTPAELRERLTEVTPYR